MRLPTDHDRLFEVFSLQTLERLQQTGPATNPQLEKFCPAAKRVHELVVSITPWLLPIRRQKVRPAGGQVSGDVPHDDGDGVRVPIESGVEFVSRHLLDGSIRQTLVGLENRSPAQERLFC